MVSDNEKEMKMTNPVTAFEHALLVKRVAARFAMEFPTDDALKEYLKEHPDADRSKHHVKVDKKPETGPTVDKDARKQLKKILDFDSSHENERLSKARTLDKIKPILERSHKNLKSLVNLAAKFTGDKGLETALREAKDLLQKVDSRPSPEGSKGADQAIADASNLLGAFSDVKYLVNRQKSAASGVPRT